MKDFQVVGLAGLVLLVYSLVVNPENTPTKVVYAYTAPPKRVVKNTSPTRFQSTALQHVISVDGVEVPEGYEYWKTVTAKVTAYEPSSISCGIFADGRTSTMKDAWRLDGCAIAPNLIPYDTMVYIPGVGCRIADDTGAAMRRSARRGIIHIDVRMTYPSECYQWGVKWLKVHLFRKKSG